MRFKLDENLPVRALEVLRAAGHDAVNLLDQIPAGAEDAAVAQLGAPAGPLRGPRVTDALDVGAHSLILRRTSRVLTDHFAALERVHEERFEPSHGPLAAGARRAAGLLLDCARLDHGFARVRCGQCRARSCNCRTCSSWARNRA